MEIIQKIREQNRLSCNFRRALFNDKQIAHLKRYFLESIRTAFYEENGKIILSQDEVENIKKIFNWLIGKDIDVTLNKGLFLTGDYGTGKSVILKGIIKFIDRYYSHDYLINGISNPMLILSWDMANYFMSGNEIMINKMKTTSILAIDELGYEPLEVNYYGSICKPFAEIIMQRYQRRRCILISTNLTMEDIKIIYGGHIYDRLCQMVYVIEFRGNSKRK